MTERADTLPDLERHAKELVESMASYRSAAQALRAASDAVVEAQGRLGAVEERAADLFRRTHELVAKLEGIDPAGLFEQLTRTHAANEATAAEAADRLLRSIDLRQATARELSDLLVKQFEAQSGALTRAFQAAVNAGVVAAQVHEAFAPQFAELVRQLHAQRQQVEFLQQKTFTVIKEEISGVRTSVYDATVGGGLSAQVEAVVAPRIGRVDDQLVDIIAELAQANTSYAALQEVSATTCTAIQEIGEAVAAANRLISDEIVPLRLAVESQGRTMGLLLIANAVIGAIAVILAFLS